LSAKRKPAKAAGVHARTATRTAPPTREVSLKLDMTIPARTSAISPLVDAVLRLVHQGGNRHEMAIETALREALANAIKHGCCGDPEKSVRCTVDFSSTADVHIVVRDPGRGVYLIRRLMDEVRFRHGGSEIHMRKY